MDQILAQVKRAQRRLWLELFANRLMLCWFAALALAVLAIAAPKVVAIEQLPVDWNFICLGAGLGGGLLIAIVWTLLSGRSELEAAAEIDARFGLKERVASSLSMTPDAAASPAGQALLGDALHVVRKLEVQERFPVRLERRSWLPLISALAAFVLVTFVENRPAQSSVDLQDKQLAKQQIDAATKKLRERMVERRKKAAEKGLTNAEGLFRELEKETEKMAKSGEADRKKTLVKLNDLAKQLQQRRENLGGKQEVRKQLEQMKGFNQGPGDKMVEAMKQGNWQAAKQQLDKLKQQLEKGELDEQAKKELAQQLKQIQEKMAAVAEARKQAMDELKKQIEQQKQQGNMQRAGELQQKLGQMKRQQQQMNKLAQLAQKAGECQQCMKQGDGAGAAQALDQMMKQMEQLEQEMAEGEMLEAALDQLQMAKDAMACKTCQGQGCQACQGGAGNKFSEKPGNGMGAGRGFGPRPDEKNDVNFRDSRVRQKPGKGSAVVVGEAVGPNVRGQVGEAIRQEMASSASEPADPTVVEQLPKSRREHAEDYFNLLREGP
jgi:Mg2+ and Co2+ transporter CorA